MNHVQICNTPKGTVEYSLTGTGPTILIVHGGHDSCQGDYMNQKMIENHYSVLIPSRPGYGNTPIESGKTAQSTADLFAYLLEALQIPQVFILGNSAGGPVALEFARQYPEKVKKMILESAVVKPWFHKLTIEYYGAKYIFSPKRQRKFWDKLASDYEKNPKKVLRKNLKIFTKINPDEMLESLSSDEMSVLAHSLITGNDSGSGFVYDIEHRAINIHEVACPTLIIHSKNDGTVPYSHAQYAYQMIQNAELYESPTASHFLYIGPGSEEVFAKRMSFIKAGETVP